jgi:hypothetical protein
MFLRAVARAELRKLHDRTGITTVYVTHDQVEAVGLGDRVAVMQAGALRQLGSPQELYNEPASTFVAGFIGTPPMNLLEHGGTIVGFARSTLFRAPRPRASDGFALGRRKFWHDLKAPPLQRHFWVRNEPYALTDLRPRIFALGYPQRMLPLRWV